MAPDLWTAYRLRWKRRRILWRAYQAGKDLQPVQDRTSQIRPGDILAIVVLRNEMARLPWFLRHYRALSVRHFLMVDNGSDDGGAEYLAGQGDVSSWSVPGLYRDAHFGRDWSNALLQRYGHNHWCLVLDADELLVYSGSPDKNLHDLTHLLDKRGQAAFGALMLEPYPETGLGSSPIEPEKDPMQTLRWFDKGPYRAARQTPMQNLWVQGGVRERVFFAHETRRSPTLNKLPLIKWNRRWAFVNSTHSALPWRLNLAYDGPGDKRPSGVLLHTKFLSDVVNRAEEDRARAQHFHDPTLFRGYYDKIAARPVLKTEESVRFESIEHLVRLGLMPAIDW
ncbi:MAG: glycosyltransferase family 2 protein [Arenibacterium sp.]